MKLTQKEIKQRHFDKVYQNAPEIQCACGCGTKIKSKDRYARDKKYVSGHNGKKYDDPKQYKREYHKKVRELVAETKIWLIKLKGSRCFICGYEFDGRNQKAFDFHHRDSDLKIFDLSHVKKSKESEERMLKEAEKCDLLCAVCHRLTHTDYFN